MAGALIKLVVPLLLILFLNSFVVAQQAEAQDGGIEKQLRTLQKVQDYNEQIADSTLRNVSFLIAFLGGVLSFLAPCTVALFPAFLANVARSKRNVTLSTLVFFAGFSISFVTIGIVLTSFGKISFATFQRDISTFVQAAGQVLVFLGVLTIFSKGFSFMRFRQRLPVSFLGTFVFGGVFAIGWSACIGPVIAGIFIMAAVLHNYAYAAVLLFFYALGLAVPLFAAAFLYDRFDFSRSKLIQGFLIKLRVGTRELVLSSTSLISGLLLVFMGVFFMVNQGTTAITAADLLGFVFLIGILAIAAAVVHKFAVVKLVKSSNLRKVIAVAEIFVIIAAFAFITHGYSVRTTGLSELLSGAVLENAGRYSLVAGILLAAFVAVLAYFVRKQLKK
ncbi:cytochrome c biogenesis protein CcdA [Candidatus Woesearchaeota archaeon]|nr:cytochrome c biogenesis protein CcdA [Candidatus Woesearchaeota archaeon]